MKSTGAEKCQNLIDLYMVYGSTHLNGKQRLKYIIKRRLKLLNDLLNTNYNVDYMTNVLSNVNYEHLNTEGVNIITNSIKSIVGKRTFEQATRNYSRFEKRYGFVDVQYLDLNEEIARAIYHLPSFVPDDFNTPKFLRMHHKKKGMSLTQALVKNKEVKKCKSELVNKTKNNYVERVKPYSDYLDSFL